MAAPNKIFPHEIAQYTVEQHFQDHNPRGRIIYLSVLGLMFLALILLFVIHTDVSVRSAGQVRPIQERTDIRTPVEGIVDSLYVTENAHVTAGQVLMKIHSQSVDEKTRVVGSQVAEVQAEVADLNHLLQGQDTVLTSQLYQQQAALYHQKLADAQNRYELVSREYGRYSTLYRQRVISAAEFDKYSFDMKSATTDLNLVKEQQYSQWQGDLTRLTQQLATLGATKSAYQDEQGLYEIKAPVSGNVQQLKGIQPGSFVTPNDQIGEISPDSGLIVETYVTPKDIGLVQVGSKARIQVDAFDYNSWGMLTGRVVSISPDVFTDKGNMFFKVRCQLDKPTLKLRNGFIGQVKKGMTVQARFVVAHRSLFQLLYDNADDWLDPNKTKK